MPRVAISVDMLDTGIDVRELVNLVFVKPVYSYTKFWQMIGRGTRLLEKEKIKPWCTEKDTFLILDCWDNFEYFKLNPRGKELKAQIPLPVRLFGVRLEKIQEAQNQGKTEIVEKEVQKIRKQVEGLPKNSVVILDAKHELQRLEDENFWNNLTSDKLEFLKSGFTTPSRNSSLSEVRLFQKFESSSRCNSCLASRITTEFLGSPSTCFLIF